MTTPQVLNKVSAGLFGAGALVFGINAIDEQRSKDMGKAVLISAILITSGMLVRYYSFKKYEEVKIKS